MFWQIAKTLKIKNEVGIDKKYWNRKWRYYSIALWENPTSLLVIAYRNDWVLCDCFIRVTVVLGVLDCCHINLWLHAARFKNLSKGGMADMKIHSKWGWRFKNEISTISPHIYLCCNAHLNKLLLHLKYRYTAQGKCWLTRRYGFVAWRRRA